jgi:hypothetical protein
LADAVATGQPRKADSASLVATNTISFSEIARGHLFQSQVEIVGDELLVFGEDERTSIQQRRRLDRSVVGFFGRRLRCLDFLGLGRRPLFAMFP